MNILVTGGNRGLGLKLLKVFAAHGHSTAPIIRRQNTESTIKAVLPDCAVFIADITDYEQLSQTDVFPGQHIDILINNAGSASCGMSVTDTDSAKRIFLLATQTAINNGETTAWNPEQCNGRMI
jgi:NAD(P)-dependent dehydrogenase (short-subunit alcohol dehydrogenase family)